MPARIPTLNKSPFAFDSRPLEEMGSAYACLLATSRAIRSLGLAGLVEANIKLKARQRGFSEGQMIESLVLLQTLGGDCPDDVSLLQDDECHSRGLGYPQFADWRGFRTREPLFCYIGPKRSALHQKTPRPSPRSHPLRLPRRLRRTPLRKWHRHSCLCSPNW